MFTLLAAATVVLAAAPPSRAPGGPETLTARIIYRSAPTPLCRGAGRMQTSGPESALLYRKDQDALRIKKLIEMPAGEMCLLGGVDTPSR